jgi:preprotein translocase subunit SecE
MAKSTQVVSSVGPRRRQRLTFDDIRHWARDSRNELRKVTWPTPEQTRNLTVVVICVCVVMAVFLGVVDLILHTIVNAFIGA